MIATRYEDNVRAMKALIAENRRRLAETYSAIARSRRLLNPWWGISGGSDDDDLRLAVRKRLERGTLWLAPGQMGPELELGNTCVVCAQRISSDESVVQGSGLWARFIGHLQCFIIWEEESIAYVARHRHPSPEPQHDIPAAS